MITRHDLSQLQLLTKVPALSILLPTHRTFPDNKQDPILVKNLVDEAKERLSEEFSSRELEPLLNNLEALVSEINYPHTLDGLALYASHDFAKCYYLPFTVPARVVIDQTFATRDLVYGLHRELQYWVLLLSQASTRLFAGTGETLEEVEDQTFPMPMTGPGATAALPFDSDSSHRRFFQQVDSAFSSYAQDEALPLIVGGVDRQISFFQEVSQHASAIAGTLSGNLDRATIHELTPQVWAIMQSVRETQQTDALQELAAAVGAQKVVSTIEEVWRLAQAGRGKRLLVEKNYHLPAILTANGGLEVVEQAGGTEVMDDAVDEIIEAILAKGGSVSLVEDGSLSADQQIALILRY
jgi:Bacterial archaeo-eukaryotic release factor family 3